MKRNGILYLFIAVFLVYSCGERNSTSEKTSKTIRKVEPLIKIVHPSNGEQIPFGNDINLELKLLNDSIQPDSIQLFVGKEYMAHLQGLQYEMQGNQLTIGTKQIRATAWRDGQRQTASVSVRVISDVEPKQWSYKVVKTYPHDIEAYTQGLFYYNGHLIESTGQQGQSSLRRVELKTGKVLQSVNLERQYFGEGATVYNHEFYQITWTSRKGFVYDAETFNLVRTFEYSTQGWGLTTIDDMLLMSDGSNALYFIEPKSFAEIKKIEVFDHKGPVNQLNELEYIEGKVYANVYTSDKIVVIDPKTGRVDAEIDFSGLLDEKDRHRGIDVFNGIAWDNHKKRIFVTGKNWPKLYEIEIIQNKQ